LTLGKKFQSKPFSCELRISTKNATTNIPKIKVSFKVLFYKISCGKKLQVVFKRHFYSSGQVPDKIGSKSCGIVLAVLRQYVLGD